MVFRLLKLFLKSIGGHHRCGHIRTSENSNNYLKGRYVFISSFLLFFSACTSDIALVDQKETRVVVDSFVQAEQIEELDVLVSLDTSGSMHDNFEDVGSGMDILRMDIESLTLDYKFGFITMDPTNLGYVGPYGSSSSTIDLLLAPSLLPSTTWEEGFAATYSFLNSEDGIDFRRPNADFLLFLISDEEEQSTIAASIFKEWLEEEFKSIKHDIVCIVNPDDGTGSSWGYEIGYKYIELSNLYGKDVIDIESEDWSVWRSESSYLTQRKDYVELSESDPILNSIVVYVNSEITYDWYYIENSNVVQLNFVPDYGELVEVGYKVLL